ncbi:unnamed protein product [Schistocephalus solidus]|uniref:Aldose reductase n=1 Tax=Schistocephalus solidus TaxID=70667 RepID=A0A183SQN5_SCHSO|nr:unnamed protein product [Schistocephalus solidus]
MSTNVPCLTFNNGFKVPVLGLGSFRADPNEVGNAVSAALDVGYRHLDCAALYDNEEEIGKVLTQKFNSGALKREEVFITTKPSSEFFSKDETGQQPFDNTPIEDTWKAMEDLVDLGLTRSIGLSNFNKSQIERILKICRIKPVMLQVEISVNFLNEKLVQYAKSVGLQVTGFAPFGSPTLMTSVPSPLTEPYVKAIADAHHKTPAQVLIRHAIQRGICVIPKSTNPERVRSNFQVFDFELTDAEMKTLNTSGKQKRLFDVTMWKAHPEYPFDAEY